jgi:hypothetical protein
MISKDGLLDMSWDEVIVCIFGLLAFPGSLILGILVAQSQNLYTGVVCAVVSFGVGFMVCGVVMDTSGSSAQRQRPE